MPIDLVEKDLVNIQQMEVAVNGPDGATHLILCTGVVHLGCAKHETYTFLVGPRLARRQFVAVIASGAWSHFQTSASLLHDPNQDASLQASILTIAGDYDEVYGRVKISADVALGPNFTKLALSYNVSILAELTKC